MQDNYSEVVSTAKNYYDSLDADQFYYLVWGGEDIHIGMYESPSESIAAASVRTVEKMAQLLAPTATMHILDLGAGYGGSARYLAKNFGCQVTCLNLSVAQNQRNIQKNQEQGLSDKIAVIDGNFEKLPFENESFDAIWSQDAFLHSGEKEQVFAEMQRVLRPGGAVIFTDPMQDDAAPEGVLANVYARIHLQSLGSFAFYQKLAANLGWETVGIHDFSAMLPTHYASVQRLLAQERPRLEEKISAAYIDRMLAGLEHWVNAGREKYLHWGILHFRKPK